MPRWVSRRRLCTGKAASEHPAAPRPHRPSASRALKPFLLRRAKADVLADVPARVERSLLCPLSPLQLQVHRLLLRSELDHSPDAPSLQNLLMQRRKLSNHPFLVLEGLRSIPGKYATRDAAATRVQR